MSCAQLLQGTPANLGDQVQILAISANTIAVSSATVSTMTCGYELLTNLSVNAASISSANIAQANSALLNVGTINVGVISTSYVSAQIVGAQNFTLYDVTAPDVTQMVMTVASGYPTPNAVQLYDSTSNTTCTLYTAKNPPLLQSAATVVANFAADLACSSTPTSVATAGLYYFEVAVDLGGAGTSFDLINCAQFVLKASVGGVTSDVTNSLLNCIPASSMRSNANVLLNLPAGIAVWAEPSSIQGTANLGAAGSAQAFLWPLLANGH